VNIIDIVIIAILAFCIIRGLMLGLINSISSLFAIVAGVFLSKRYYQEVYLIMKGINLPDHHGIISYVIVFLLFFIGFKVLFFLIKQVSTSSGLSGVDRVLGVILGLAKGLLIAGIMITAVQVLLPPRSNVIATSVLLPYYNKIIAISGFIPSDFIQYTKKN